MADTQKKEGRTKVRPGLLPRIRLDPKIGVGAVISLAAAFVVFLWKFFHPPFIETGSNNFLVLYRTDEVDKFPDSTVFLFFRTYRAFDFVETSDYIISEHLHLTVGKCSVKQAWKYFVEAEFPNDRVEIEERVAAGLPISSGEIKGHHVLYHPDQGFYETPDCPFKGIQTGDTSVVFGLNWDQMIELMVPGTVFSVRVDNKTARGNVSTYHCNGEIYEHVPRYMKEKGADHVILYCT